MNILVATANPSSCPSVRSVLMPLLDATGEFGSRYDILVTRNDAGLSAGNIRMIEYGNYFNLLARIFTVNPRKYNLLFSLKAWSVTGFACLLVSALKGIKYLLFLDDYHSGAPRKLRNLHEPIFEWYLRKRAKNVVVISAGLKKYYPQAVYIPTHHVDLEHFRRDQALRDRVRRESGWKESETVFLWVANFIRLVDRHYILEVFAELERKIDNLRLVLAGDGPVLAEIRDNAAALGIGNIQCLGRVPFRDMPGIYCGADIGLLPLVDTAWDRCKNPSKLYEYMAMELPVIATGIGEAVNVIEEAKCGLLIPYRRKEDAVAKIAGFLEGDLRGAGKRGRDFLEGAGSLATSSRRLYREMERIAQGAG